MNFRTIFLFFIFNIFTATSGNAQLIPLQNYTVKNGLPSNTINDIEQDQQGYLWLATQVGAVRFDGYNFQIYSNNEGIPDKSITDILIGSDGKVWIGTENGGLAIITNGKISLLNIDNGLISNEITQLFEDRDKNVWCLTNAGVSVIKNNQIQNFNESNSPLKNAVLTHEIDSSGTVWVATIDGIFKFSKIFIPFENPIVKDAIIRDILFDSDGSMWLATQEKGVIKIDNENNVFVFDEQTGLGTNLTFSLCKIGPNKLLVGTYLGGLFEIENNKVTKKWHGKIDEYILLQILVDKQDRIWIRTLMNGVLLLENSTIQLLNKENGLVDDRITKIFLDDNGGLWFPTQNGLSKYGKVLFEIFNTNFIDNELNIQSIRTSGDKILMGTYSGLNVISPNGDINNVKLDNSRLDYSSVLSIYTEGDETWLGVYGGLVYLQNNKSEYLLHDVFTNHSYPICPTDIENFQGNMYCATEVGLITYNHTTFKRIKFNGLVPENTTIWNLKKGPDQQLWCASMEGLLVFDGNFNKRYTEEDGLPTNHCLDLDFDPSGNLWLATEKGISKITVLPDKTIKCTNITQSEGLISNDIFFVISDKQGFTWAGHNKGLERINQSNLTIKHYSNAEGFLPVETSLGAATLSDNGDLWFGTVEGAVKYTPSNDIENTKPPRAYITSVALLNDSTPLSNYAKLTDSLTGLPVGVKLPFNKNNLVFQFVGLHYTIVEKNLYSYKLEGFDNDWSLPGTEIQTLYRKLPPGKYIFNLRASNCDGVWTVKPIKFSFEIKPPFYRTWWFTLIEVIILIVALVAYIRLRERKLRKDKQILAQRVKERTIEVEKQRDQIARQNEEITDSIKYAKRIQTAVLPKSEIINEFLSEYFILYLPRDIVSGDFYWMNQRDNKIIIVAADCTGHGVPGAFMSMLGISILNEVSVAAAHSTSGQLLDTLRNHLTITLWQTGKEEDTKDGMDMVLCILDIENNTLQFSGAYNPLVIIRNDEILLYKADKMPVGYHMGEMPPFSTHEITLQPGDYLYMYSDGYEDQFGGPDEKKYKSVPFRNLLLEHHKKPMNEQKEILFETFNTWKGIHEQVDDILVIGLKIN